MGHFLGFLRNYILGDLSLGFLDPGRYISVLIDDHLQFIPEPLGTRHSSLASCCQAPSSHTGDLIGQSVR